MLRNQILSFILLFALCLFINCEKGQRPISRTYGNFAPIEGNIIFKVIEGHKELYCDCEPEIMLDMETEKIYGCCNFSIMSEILQTGNNITVKLLGIYMPDVCAFAFGPAKSRKFLSIPEGQYTLNFLYEFAVDRYVLIVTDSYIKLFKIESIITKNEFEVFCRYPPNSFVYLCGTTTETSWICEDFLGELLSEIDLEEFQFPAYGEICYPSSSQGHYYDMPARYFFYNNEKDFDKAGEILKAYTQRVIVNYSGADISLRNWKDKSYKSWLFYNN